jgi:putative acetyltransferase
MDLPIIRLIEKKDNPQIAKVIRSVLEDFNVPKVGTAYADKALDCMFETYQKPRSAYFVVIENDKIIGGAGVAKLDNYDGNVCELQKMYFLPEARGRKLGAQIMTFCTTKAREFGYEKIYLETMEYMTHAQKLYQQTGFEYIERAMGDTGHYSCPVHMIKTL